MVDAILMVEYWGRVRAALVLSFVAFALVVPTTAGAAVVRLSEDSGTYGVTEVAAVEYAFRELINEERAGEGLQPLASFSDLIDNARLQATDMSDAGYLYHNPGLAEVTASENWFKLGENVGYGPTVDVLHQAFMDSPPHAQNVLKDVYNYIGVGAVIDPGGTIWVAMVYMHGPEGLTTDPDEGPETYRVPFVDDDGSLHEVAIAAISAAGITAGCDPAGDLFCPTEEVTRGQMATLLDRAIGFADTDEDFFGDDHDSVHEDAINRLAAAGVTMGCGDDMFCPDDPVLRSHMAAFLSRALDLSDVALDFFADDDDSPHQSAINALADFGVTGGCGGDSFCPDATVTRGQMATLIARALGLV